MVPTDIYATRITSRVRRDLAGLFIQSLPTAKAFRLQEMSNLDVELQIAAQRVIARTAANWQRMEKTQVTIGEEHEMQSR